ncbi:UDP-N-acetylmuramoyl-L-alanyl-D-glutamate--2,6-diaminopimelate ligase [Angustibacter sp. Root456]|uniref:UDP-N-acetylmuramoyl-L-alanyl-D-glutamate--2, 6-diaminopimelate ligase n=1 Tax=Angustibacter sp. Root456 TaxID=1736539 RepID=UPI001F397FDE|nr:UDP-N-acetylmuramoyl-L-alanyl-D-glutamate--2,6-diaminopimelate ligase [Angustibacter sp. Root456]
MSAAAVPSSAGLRPSVTSGCTLGELVDAASGALALDPAGAGGTRVTGVTLDSRAIRPGDLYAALPGSRAHGAQFAAAARDLGAVAVLTDAAGRDQLREADVELPVLLADDPRAVLGSVAADVFGRPAADLALLGVTGTNGKTTTTFLMDAVLRAGGFTTGLIGTVETRVGEERLRSVRTTPEAPDLHALLAAMRERGVQVCSMEVSSQALAQHRVDAAVVDVAGFSNFSRDHLELHGDMATYLAAKELLLTPEHSRRAVVVVDDDGTRTAASRASVPVTTLSGRADAGTDWVVTGREPRDGGTDFQLCAADGRRLDLRCPLPGEFNVMNAALAAVMLLEHGLTEQQVAHGLRHAGGVPGRMEVVGDPTAGPLAVVDYAHTPDAVAAALQTLRSSVAGRLVVVLGAGGDRDPDKRPLMGAAAARAADVVVITDDNPRSEDPAAIRAAVLAGAREAAAPHVEVLEVADRRQAIGEGARRAGRPGDVLLVAGKGHEPGQEIAGVVHPFDDREELAAALAEVQS